MNQMTENSTATKSTDGLTLDLVCIKLLCDLESLTSVFREKSLGERIETASNAANEILVQLLDFSEEHFDGPQADLLQEHVQITLERRKEHEFALKQRSWGHAIKSLLIPSAVDPATVVAYDQLGKSLHATCGVVLAEMQKLIEIDSPVRSQINEGSMVFLDELKGVWL